MKKVKEDSGRRTWDLSSYQAKDEKASKTSAEPTQRRILPFEERTPLQPHEGDSDLFKDVGKHEKISDTTPVERKGGFYCELCKTQVPDSKLWLDHLNGRKHQLLMGRHMAPMKSSVQEVLERIEFHSQKKRLGKRKSVLSLNERLESFKRRLEEKLDQEEEKVLVTEEDELNDDQKALKAMGMAVSFAGGRK